MTKKASYRTMNKVLQAKFKDRRRSKWTRNSLSHTAWKCQYHTVFIPKYRKKRLYGAVRAYIRDIINTLCHYKGVEIIDGAVCIDHVHLCVSIPPKMSVSVFMGYLKGKSALMIFDRHPELQSKWNKAFWARGYYVSTVGNVTEEAKNGIFKNKAKSLRKKKPLLSGSR